MTTTARPAQGLLRRGTPQVLVVAGLCVLLAGAVVTVVGAMVAGSPGAMGALVGASIALCLFMSGSLVVETATRMAPQTALVIALMTYALQVAVVAALFVVLKSSGLMGDTLSAGWLATGVIVATVTWQVAQLAAAARARVPAYDIELPGAPESSPRPSPAPSPEGVSGSSPNPREVGAR